ncbi:MAG: hypothetical protein AAGL98_04350, partial [Planctomycetota bacterium]
RSIELILSDLFIGVPGGPGFALSSGTIAIASVTGDPSAPSAFSFFAVSADLGAASLVGIPEFTLSAATLSLQINRGANTNTPNAPPAGLDWTADGNVDLEVGGAFEGDAILAGGTAFDFSGTLTQVSGTGITLNIADFLIATGASFVISQSTLENVAIGAQGTLTEASLLDFNLTGLELRIGVGATLQNGAIVETNFIGFSVSGAVIDVALLGANPGVVADTRSFTAVSVTLDGASLEGLDGILEFDLTNASFLYNAAAGADGATAATPIDWTDPGDDLPDFAGLTETIGLVIAGSATLDIAGFVTGNADFALTQQVVNVDLTGNGAADLTGASLLTLGLVNLNLTAGAGDIALALTEGTLGIAILAPAAVVGVADTRSFVAVSSRVGNVDLQGVPEVTATFSDLSVDVNRASGLDAGGTAAAPIDWNTAIDLGADGSFSDIVDPAAALPDGVDPVANAMPITLAGEFLAVSGNVDILDVAGVVQVTEGAFALEIQDVDLTGTGTPVVGAKLVTLGVEIDRVFVGAGGVGIELLDGALAIASLTNDADLADTRSFTAVSASLGAGNFIGLPSGVELAASAVVVNLNTASDANGAIAALDWTQDVNNATAVTLDVGTSTVVFDQTVEILEIGGTLT